MTGVPVIASVLVMRAFLAVRLYAAAACLAFPNRIIHDVIALGCAKQAVVCEGIDAIAHQPHVFYIRLFATRSQPITVHQLVFP